jgi:hypothetical protein
MKATIIGSDLLKSGDSVKFLEINTNTTIYNDGADLLDYTELFNVITSNDITEFHFIWTEGDAYKPANEPYKFKQILEQKCAENNIAYFNHMVPFGSVTVPYIEDADNKFILRQSFDTTALIDDTYCADKFEFFSLMSGSTYSPNTYFTSETLSLNTLNDVDYSRTSNPNTLIKYRYPTYDVMLYPALYTISDNQSLLELKGSMESDFLAQEFIYSEDNIIDGRYSVIRSIDIIYGPNLDIINLGGYTQSAIIPILFANDEFVEGTNKLNQKTRYKYITKEIGGTKTDDYHTDDDSNILNFDGTLTNVNTIQLGDYMRSINFTDFNENQAGKFTQSIEVYAWDSTVTQANETLVQESTSLVGKTPASIGTIYIRITLEDGRSWTDAPGCVYFIEEKDSTQTRFEKVNCLYIGDKLVITDASTNQLTTVTISNLQMEFTEKTIYSLDFEPSDLFLVDIGDGDYSVMHNSCWCPWNYCGYFCRSSWCPSCSFGNQKLQP